MIDEEIKIIINDILFHTRKMLTFLKNGGQYTHSVSWYIMALIKTGKYDPYLDDLIDYALCTEEDIQTIQHYIFEIEIKLYNILKGGASNE